MNRQMHLGLFLLGTGSHSAGWRYPGAVKSFLDLPAMQRIAQTAERACFDMIFLGDNLNADFATHPSYTLRHEPLTLLSALAMGTRHVGLGATMSTTYSDPYTVARVFASLDHLSGGRAAWNAVTTSHAGAAANFGTVHPDHARRYEMAGEFVDVVKGLWDCWDDDAVVADVDGGTYIDTSKVHALDHEGAFFKVKGPLNTSRSPQGRPVVLQAGGSEPGTDLAARTADVVFSVAQDMEEARKAYAALKAKLPRYGRQASDVTVLPGVMPVVGRTDREAREKLNRLQGFIGTGNALGVLSERFGVDFSSYDLDAPVPELPPSDAYQAFTKVLLSKARRDGMSLRDLYSLTAAARGHWVLCGSAENVADTLQQWFESGAADGFNVMPPYFHEGFDDFVELVVPILQRRGLFRSSYAGPLLRDQLGLLRPAVERAR
ncbi:LLM class flavin-dependent oxidoreductase [Variovorax sp. UC122_21]|uniref:LLM class flavin-dependent oxidoreductase n=1 Tax=Variovorax sp. UC122_21 TaxID=3374554 RepID=UPI0037565F86